MDSPLSGVAARSNDRIAGTLIKRHSGAFSSDEDRHVILQQMKTQRCLRDNKDEILTLPREIVDLASGGGERIFDRHLNMLVPFVVGRPVIDYDVFVRWNCKRDVDMEVAAVTGLVAGCYHGYAASNDTAIVLFQPLYFTFDRNAHRLQRIGSFKGHLQRDLHNDLSVAVNPRRQSTNNALLARAPRNFLFRGR